jgi:hypothetical protein
VARAIEEGRLALHAWLYDLSAARLCFWDTDRQRFAPEGDGTISVEQIKRHDDA